VNAVRLTARDLWCLLREQRREEALAEIRQTARGRFYMNTEQVVVRKELTAAEAPANGAIRIEEAERADLPALAEFNRRQCSTSRTRRFEQGLAEGRRALLGFRGGELIGYFWWHDDAQPGSDFYLARFGLGLADGEMYGYDLFIAPEHRGSGTPAEFLAGVEAALARLGYRRMFGFVESTNRPARWLYATSGYEDVMRCRIRTVLRRLIHVEGRGWLVSGKHGLRPLAGSGPLARRRLGI
jgi:GNAT superfamily N-acetyltransferase